MTGSMVRPVDRELQEFLDAVESATGQRAVLNYLGVTVGRLPPAR